MSRMWQSVSVSAGQFYNNSLASTNNYFSNLTNNANKIYFALRG